jgi:hypothetical protein
MHVQVRVYRKVRLPKPLRQLAPGEEAAFWFLVFVIGPGYRAVLTVGLKLNRPRSHFCIQWGGTIVEQMMLGLGLKPAFPAHERCMYCTSENLSCVTATDQTLS